MRYFLFILLAFLGCCAGSLFFAWYHELIIINVKKSSAFHPKKSREQIIGIWYFKGSNWYQEQQPIITDPDDYISYAHKVIEEWLSSMAHNSLMYKKAILQSIAYNNNNTDIFISFDRTIFNKQQSTYQKIMLINGLSKTLQENGIKAQRMHLLVNHEYLSDPHILCDYGLPLSGFIPNHSK